MTETLDEKPRGEPQAMPPIDPIEAALDEALSCSFPASDPPALFRFD